LLEARRYLDQVERKDISLIITGGLRVPADFVKAMALGLDAIATQKEHLRKKLIVDESAGRLEKFFGASVELMKVLSRACSHSHFNEFELSDLQRGKKK
jgi:glutamate synthase domain-containing protein 2